MPTYGLQSFDSIYSLLSSWTSCAFSGSLWCSGAGYSGSQATSLAQARCGGIPWFVPLNLRWAPLTTIHSCISCTSADMPVVTQAWGTQVLHHGGRTLRPITCIFVHPRMLRVRFTAMPHATLGSLSSCSCRCRGIWYCDITYGSRDARGEPV
jgi:hypothetical protein